MCDQSFDFCMRSFGWACRGCHVSKYCTMTAPLFENRCVMRTLKIKTIPAKRTYFLNWPLFERASQDGWGCTTVWSKELLLKRFISTFVLM